MFYECVIQSYYTTSKTWKSQRMEVLLLRFCSLLKRKFHLNYPLSEISNFTFFSSPPQQTVLKLIKFSVLFWSSNSHSFNPPSLHWNKCLFLFPLCLLNIYCSIKFVWLFCGTVVEMNSGSSHIAYQVFTYWSKCLKVFKENYCSTEAYTRKSGIISLYE